MVWNLSSGDFPQFPSSFFIWNVNIQQYSYDASLSDSILLTYFKNHLFAEFADIFSKNSSIGLNFKNSKFSHKYKLARSFYEILNLATLALKNTNKWYRYDFMGLNKTK